MLEEIKNYEGKPILNEQKKSTTVRELISVALNNPVPNEALTAEKKVKVYQISIKIWENKEVDLTVDDRAFIKERAGKVLPSLFYGRLSDALEEKK